jgi:hypothetical protein
MVAPAIRNLVRRPLQFAPPAISESDLKSKLALFHFNRYSENGSFSFSFFSNNGGINIVFETSVTKTS